ncbi:conjugal transfer protein TraX [Tissierella sp. P1]|uniref:TraX family protein n=1 Tax=Tissierella sp. P1 TaxID=1280483 RepID=UPI000BA07D07|nr:TraX family protein [Tissierella sp. P1]OZV10947.1 conjugal transfer protein TraX [Tissierella sp. P1]
MNAFILKIIMAILMVFDHVASVIGNAPIWFTWLGKLVAPIFFYLVVEGFFHTSNRKRYALRLYLWSITMFAGSALLSILVPSAPYIKNNIFLSLAHGVTMLIGIDYIKTSKDYKKGLPLAIIFGILGLITEASILGVLMFLIFYFCRDKKTLLSTVYVLVFTLLIVPISLNTGEGTVYEKLLLYDPQILMIFAVPFILLYNGERGPNNKFTKYFFYVFYPLHLWILAIIKAFMI